MKTSVKPTPETSCMYCQVAPQTVDSARHNISITCVLAISLFDVCENVIFAPFCVPCDKDEFAAGTPYPNITRGVVSYEHMYQATKFIPKC